VSTTGTRSDFELSLFKSSKGCVPQFKGGTTANDRTVEGAATAAEQTKRRGGARGGVHAVHRGEREREKECTVKTPKERVGENVKKRREKKR